MPVAPATPLAPRTPGRRGLRAASRALGRRGIRATKALALALLALPTIPTAGCGYTLGHAPRPEGVRTVAVAVVANETFRQRLEIPLTRELYEALAIYTTLTPTAFDRADAILEVRVEGIDSEPLVAGRPLPVTE